MYGTVPDGTTKDLTRPGGPAPLPLTPGRRAALALGVPVCLVVVLAIAFNVVAAIGRASIPVRYALPAGAAGVSVSTSGGDLSLRQATSGQASLTGTASYSLIRPHLTRQFTAGQDVIGYSCPMPLGDCGLDGTLSVPSGTHVSIATGGGNVSAVGTNGQVSISTGGGDLTANQMAGDLTLSTGGGNITATTVTATQFSADTGGGNITASAVSSSQVIADTGGGDVEIVFTTVPHNVQVSTGGGNVTIIVPPGTAEYHVTATPTGGTLTNDLPQNSASTNQITATTSGGNITLRQSP